MKKIHIIGGGTFSHVRNHLALAAPAFGTTARQIAGKLAQQDCPYDIKLHLTAMAGGMQAKPSIGVGAWPWRTKLVTNDDMSILLDELIADPDTRCIILNAALCDYDGSIIESFKESQFGGYVATDSGNHHPRLKTSDGPQKMLLVPTRKLIGKIRKERKDIFVVGFKTTTDASSDEQYATALNMLKRDSLNLVQANDTVTRNNMIVAPEETRYTETTNRNDVLQSLVEITLARLENTFTRSTVKHGDSVPWDSELIPDNLRKVVDHLIERGAYKPFRGATVGHFAVKIDDVSILTSKRKVDFNKLAEIGLVKVEYEGDDKVVAFGAKPSVGGQSQRIVFREHPGYDCIAHAHVPLKARNSDIPIAPQWQNECGSHQCGANTSRNLREVRPGIKVVMLDGHGPNVVFRRDTPAEDVIEVFETYFDLSDKTGGLVKDVA